MTGWLAAAGAGVTIWLLAGPATFPSPRSRRPARPGAVPGGRLSLVVVAAAAGGLVVLLDGTTLAASLIVLAAAAGVAEAVVRARARRVALERADRVVEACEILAAELRAGQPPRTGLRHCAEVWPDLAPVAAAAEMGADVPDALRRLARLPGASGLADVAGAWQVSQSSGSTMATGLARVADGARRRRATQRLVAAELASAMATARLVAVLPVMVLAMGSGLGADPWAFLLGTPVGLACLGTGLGLALLGLAWIERIAVSAVDP